MCKGEKVQQGMVSVPQLMWTVLTQAPGKAAVGTEAEELLMLLLRVPVKPIP